MNTRSIGFIGGGNMATSLMSGLIASGYASRQLWVSDVNSSVLQSHLERLQVNISADNQAIAATAEVVVLAVKPQILREICQQIAPVIQQRKILVVSIAAGITQSSLAQWLGADVSIVRCMPNTPALVQSGATALHANPNVDADQKDIAESILRSVGLTLWVNDEAKLDAVTAVSGSGPAYYFLLMEAMEKAALELGLDEASARLLIQQTALGAAKIALESSDSPAKLREQVTSPGGTTQRAIESFQQHGFEAIVSKAMHAARDRSIEMSKQLGAD
jgi:pyrroline-5-carboxylate reductase